MKTFKIENYNFIVFLFLVQNYYFIHKINWGRYMKNVLNYYYNLNPISIHQINKNYKCNVNNEEYLLTLYEKNNYAINEIYELSNYLLKYNVPCHQIILNNNGDVITLINGQPYILLKIFVKNRTVNCDDLLFFSKLNIQPDTFQNLLKHNWYDMWIKKIDYFEYQISQFGKKYPLIRSSFDYYVGLAENGISFFKSIYNGNKYNLVVSHDRIKKNEGLIELYNPLNFILDNKVRDLSEYIKEQFFFSDYSIEKAKQDIYKFGLNSYEYGLFFARMLFPTYYFDCYEEVVFGYYDENELLKIISKNNDYYKFLKELYLYLKPFIVGAEIEWLIKK